MRRGAPKAPRRLQVASLEVGDEEGCAVGPSGDGVVRCETSEKVKRTPASLQLTDLMEAMFSITTAGVESTSSICRIRLPGCSA